MNQNRDESERIIEALVLSIRSGLESMLSAADGAIQKEKALVPDADLDGFSRLRTLVQVFGLNKVEREIILHCFAQELEPELGRLYATFQGDKTSPFATQNFFLKLLGDTTSDKLEVTRICTGSGRLFQHRIVSFGYSTEQFQAMPGSRAMVLDARITQFLCGSDGLDESTYGVLSVGRSRTMEEVGAIAHDSVFESGLRNMITGPNEGVLALQGDYGSELYDIAAAVAHERTGGHLCLRLSQLPGPDEGNVRNILFRCVREALLWEMELVIPDLDGQRLENKTLGPVGRYLLALREVYPVPLILLMNEAVDFRMSPEEASNFREIKVALPSVPLREKIWAEELANVPVDPDAMTPAELARRFKFPGGRIRAAASFARNQAAMERGMGASLGRRNLLNGCRSQSNRRLGDVVDKVEIKFNWNDIVLPDEQMTKLREACSQVQHMEEVFDEWGFEKVIGAGRGLNMLFSGPSGTGKTMAATIMAAELGLEMYKVDLSTVISKYIGETEKNLSRIFAEAETAHAILFFDEADAMFGKRSEVQSANDRFANIEVGYLLQRMEEYTGITILATNLADNMDDAFLRRLQFMVEFPMPGPEERLEIWRKAVPEQTVLAHDVDFEFLAEKLQLSGANIKNILLQAAFHAVKGTKEIGMRDIVRGVQHEMQKESKPLLRAELGRYFDYLSSDSLTQKPGPDRGKAARKAGLS